MIGPNQALWIDALQSGNYKQSRGGLLKTERGYCCLGVAQSLFFGDSSLVNPRGFGASLGLPTADTMDRLKLRSIGGLPLNKSRFQSLISLNDTRLMTFGEIAELLEAHPEQYFTGPA